MLTDNQLLRESIVSKKLNLRKSLFFRFDDDLEVIYADLFAPMSISRVQFQKLMSVKVLGEYPKVLNLHSGECYAIQDMTKTDRLAMLLKGRINVLTEKSFPVTILA